MKKYLKLFTATLMALIMLIGVTACGNGDNNGNGGKGDSKIVEIMFHVDEKSKEGVAYKKRVNAFNQAYNDEGIKISASYIARTAGAADYEQKLIGMQNTGDLPDIITFDAPNCASYAASGLLWDITNLISKETKDDFISLNEFNGKLYGLPIQESSAGFYYNKALFNQAGIDVSGYTVENAWTFAQFKEVCNKLKNINITAVDMRLSSTDEMSTYLLYPLIYAAGGSFVSEDGYTATGYFNSTSTQKGFQFIKDLVDAGYTGYAVNDTAFFDGQVGMYLSSGWTIPDLDSGNYVKFQGRDSWGLLPYPKDAQSASATGSWSYGVTDNGRKDKTNVIKALEWLVSVESSEVVTGATGMIPARKSVETHYGESDPQTILMKQLSLTGKERPVTVGYPQFSTNFRQVLNDMKNDSLTNVLSTRATTLQKELDDLKKIYG